MDDAPKHVENFIHLSDGINRFMEIMMVHSIS